MTDVGIRIKINIDGNKAAVDGFDQVTQATTKTGDAAVDAGKRITVAQQEVIQSTTQLSTSQKSLGDEVIQATSKTGEAVTGAGKKMVVAQQEVIQSAARLSISQKSMSEAMATAGSVSQQAGQKIVSANQQTGASSTQLVQAQQRFIDGLVKQSDAIGKSNSQLALMRAQQLGVADAAAPMIAKLAQAEQGVQKVGMSAAATAAAMRNVPAQFTDIVTSLQGGQAPLTVFMQQGGQLKDMFGGVGGAAKALGGYVLGLVNPFTVAAAAAVGLGAAYYYGAQESKEFQKNIITSGGAAGVSVNQMIDLAAKINDLGIGSKSLAGESLNALVSAGNVSSSVIEKAAIASIQAQRLLGVSVVDTAKEFSELGKTPTASIEKLNDKYHFLTLEVYEQIKALEEQGKTAEAATLAQSTYSDALTRHSQKVDATLSEWERGWNRIKAATAGAVDAVFNIGREDSSAQKITKLLADREKLENVRKGAVKNGEGGYYVGKLDEQLEQNKLLINQERAKADVLKARAKAQEDANIAFEAGKQFSKDGEKYLSKEAQTLKEITKARNLGATAGLDNAVIEKRVAEIRASIGLSTEVTAYNELAKAVRDKLITSNLELNAEKTLTEAQKDRIKLQEFIAVSHGKISKQKLDEIATNIELIRTNERMQFMQAEANAAMNKFAETQVKRSKESIDGFNAQYEASIKIKQSIEDYATSMANFNEQTQLELTLAGKSERDRKIALEQFKVELELRKQIKAINEKDLGAFNSDKPGLRQKATDAAESRKQAVIVQVDTEEIQKARKELDAFLDPAKAQSFGDAMVSAMGNAGNALQKLSVSLQEYSRSELEIAKQRKNAEKTKSADPAKYAKDMAELNDKSAQSQIKNYANMAGAAKGFFKENSSGYKALEAAEKGFRAIEMAMALESMLKKSGLMTAFTSLFVASKATETTVTVAGESTKTAATLTGEGARNAAKVPGVFMSFMSMMGPWGAAAAAVAIAAVMGGAFSGGGGASVDMSAAAVQKKQGTGTVFGDSDAKSDSIKQSLELLSSNSDLMTPATMQMASSLRNIESAMAGLTNIVFRTAGITDGSNMGIQTGTLSKSSVSWAEAIVSSGIFAPVTKLLGGLWGKTTASITDGGLQLGGSVASLQQGQGVNQYANVETKSSSWFGLKKSTSNTTQIQAVSSEIAQQFGLIFTGLESTLSAAATALGANGQAVGEAVKSFVIDTTKISLKGLKGADLQNAINAVISGAMDNVSQSVFPELEKFRQVGEGYTQTVTRIAVNYSSVDAILTSVGMKFGAVGISSVAARENLIGLVGSIDKLASGTQYFAQNFLTDAERIKPVSDNVTKVMSDLGLSGVTSMEQFKNVVLGLDLSTEAGAKLYSTLIGLAPQFKEVADYNSNASGTAKQRADMEIQIMELTGNTAGALAARREIELAGMDASLRPLQQRINLLNDEADAAAKAAALGQQRTGFEIRIMELSGDKIGALNMKRKQELDGLDASLRPYQLQIYALEDKAEAEKGALAAQQASTQAAEKAAQAAQQLASAWQSAVNSMVSEISRLRGLVGGNSAASLANAQSQFSITTAQARAGDQEAFKLLPQLSQTLDKMYEASAGSLAELNRNRNLLAASLEQTAQGTTKYGVKIPGFASGGDFGGGLRLVGEHGPEIEATGASRIFNANQTKSMLGGSNDALVNALIKEVRELKTAMSLLLTPTLENEKNTRKIKDNVQRVTLDGEGMRLEKVAT